MVRLKCADCGAGVSKADVFCRSCGSSLLEEDALIAAPDAEAAPADGVPTVGVPASSEAE